ncbi:MAG: hypothetical protein ABIL58_27825 [Pseudomonadota bacterium]
MDIGKKLGILDALYRRYDEAVSGVAQACEKGCSHCCTRNVTVTTLEGYRLVDRLKAESLETLFGCLSKTCAENRFRPLITINRLAELSLADEDPPEEVCDPAWTPCALLEDNLCTIYSIRPFACRCMTSTAVCAAGGFADMPDFLVSVNTVFQQIIEHLDVPGATGNLADVLTFLKDVENRSIYRTGMIRPDALAMPANRHLKMLMIPPQHRDRLQPVVSKIQKMLAG